MGVLCDFTLCIGCRSCEYACSEAHDLPQTDLDDQYGWNLWIGIDAACGVALAAGGFTTAFIAHVMHREHFHSVVRPALLTAMLGYTFVAFAVFVDLGHYYNIWQVMLPEMWQGDSVLFEVGICVLSYLTVLYIEFLPIVTERFMGRVNLPGFWARLDGGTEAVLRFLDRTLNRVMTFFIIAGVVLSCAHQSSLGTLMVIAPSKLHPLEMKVLSPLGRMIPFLLTVLPGALIPAVIFMVHRLRRESAWLFSASALVVLGVVLNRVNVFIFPDITAEGAPHHA